MEVDFVEKKFKPYFNVWLNKLIKNKHDNKSKYEKRNIK